jgi:hypothetical protein
MRWILAFCVALSLAGAPPSAQACLDCHDTVNLEVFAKRSHGGVPCTYCHTAITGLPHPDKMPPVLCARCHDHEVQDYATSVHGVARKMGKNHAATCSSCHGKAHDIVGRRDPASRVAKKNMEATCGTCHEPGFLAKLTTHLPRRASKMGVQKQK